MSQELYYLPKPLSLSPIRSLIESSGFDLNDVAVFFDYDQTLTQSEIVPVLNPDGSRRLTSSGLPATQTKGSIRGGETTRTFLNYLNDNHIKWYVNSARGPGGVGAVSQSMRNLKIPFSPIMINKDQEECFSPKVGLGYMGKVFKDNNGVEIGICNNVISAGYNKDIATDYIISQMDTPPKLVIFVDDNATNILTLYNYFLKKTDIDILYKGVIYEPYIKAEEDHEASMHTLRGEGMPPIQEITEEYRNGGRRRKNRKTRKARKTRKNRKQKSRRRSP
jgi:hypothetical protein